MSYEDEINNANSITLSCIRYEDVFVSKYFILHLHFGAIKTALPRSRTRVCCTFHTFCTFTHYPTDITRTCARTHARKNTRISRTCTSAILFSFILVSQSAMTDPGPGESVPVPTSAVLAGTANGTSAQTTPPAPCQFCGQLGHTTKRSTKCGRHHEYVSSATSASSNKDSCWVYVNEVDEYHIQGDFTQLESYLDGRFKQHIKAVVEKGKKLVHSNGQQQATDADSDDENSDLDSMTRIDLFHTIGRGIFGVIMPWCKKQARVMGVKNIRTWEFYSWLSIYIGGNLINLNLDKTIDVLQDTFFQQ
jgi:hypothetical protein